MANRMSQMTPPSRLPMKKVGQNIAKGSKPGTATTPKLGNLNNPTGSKMGMKGMGKSSGLGVSSGMKGLGMSMKTPKI
jgi:hypothetical protein